MKKLHIGVAAITLISVTGCSSLGLGGKRVDYQAGAAVAPSLEIPPEMTTPASDDRFKIPQGDGVATYSNYSRTGSTPAVAAAPVGNLLPEVKGAHLARNDSQRWLVVEDKAEAVWPIVKAFWKENGLTIKSEEEAVGVIETDWSENRAKIPQDGVRNLIGKVFDGLYSSNERDQYRTRLERSKDGLSTEIYITHRGMAEVSSSDNSSTKWQARPNDPELEAIMLQRLLVRLGGKSAPAAEVAATNTPTPTTTSGAATLQEVYDGSQVIIIQDAFDKSWRRTGLAIEQSGLTIEDKDRTKGIYLVRAAKVERGFLDKLQFWKDSPDENARYRVTVKDGGTSCEVAATNADGLNSNDSKKLLSAIFQHINQ
ncbi:MAG: outer membrane protein assembly factor BamC [Gallionella sp.]|nr:outer membrane protein assembly factor BamC [Gallionella sp.]